MVAKENASLETDFALRGGRSTLTLLVSIKHFWILSTVIEIRIQL